MRTSINTILFLIFLLFHLSEAAGGGQWVLLQNNIGITAMHMQLLNNDRVIIFDRTDFGLSNISLPDGKCRDDPSEIVVKHDCTAHSVEYNVLSNSIRPLMVQTNVWCSSGVVAPDGHLIQTGGFNDGERMVRLFKPCSKCDWQEVGLGILARRWYATDQILPDGRAIVIGGKRQFNYEFYPKSTSTNSLISFPFLRQTHDYEENNLYPFVHLNVDGNLFIYANNLSVLFDYRNNRVVRTYPPMPEGHPRNYPSTGSSVLLPLKNISDQSSIEAEVLICGGAPRGSYQQAKKGIFNKALNTCGRIKITDSSPSWRMEKMPIARVMGDMVLLPNGNVLIINGVGAGSAGWERGIEAVLNPVIYRPDNPMESRFEIQNPTTIPRVYHSTAILLRDGRILVGGSNPHVGYKFSRVLYPTELRLEAFLPDYLNPRYSKFRPEILEIISPNPQNGSSVFKYGQSITIRFSVNSALRGKGVSVTMVSPSFNTHSFSMNQRLVRLEGGDARAVSGSTYQVRVKMPESAFLAPPGYYMLFVVHQEIPSEGMWVQIQ